jgi:hypothetical protein
MSQWKYCVAYLQLIKITIWHTCEYMYKKNAKIDYNIA